MIDRVPKLETAAERPQTVIINFGSGQELARLADAGKLRRPTTFRGSIAHQRLGRLGQIIGHLDGEDATRRGGIDQRLENIEVVRNPLEDSIGK